MVLIDPVLAQMHHRFDQLDHTRVIAFQKLVRQQRLQTKCTNRTERMKTVSMKALLGLMSEVFVRM
jgi:hypothetical protein